MIKIYNYLRSNNYFLISIGAIPAAIFRWQIDEVHIVNIIGCFLLGFINALPIMNKYKLLFGFGFCGSLTTFSGWSILLYQLLNQGLYKQFFFNLFISVLFGIFAVLFGNYLANKIIN